MGREGETSPVQPPSPWMTIGRAGLHAAASPLQLVAPRSPPGSWASAGREETAAASHSWRGLAWSVDQTCDGSGPESSRRFDHPRGAGRSEWQQSPAVLLPAAAEWPPLVSAEEVPPVPEKLRNYLPAEGRMIVRLQSAVAGCWGQTLVVFEATPLPQRRRSASGEWRCTSHALLGRTPALGLLWK